jgi:hypothetical protein
VDQPEQLKRADVSGAHSMQAIVGRILEVIGATPIREVARLCDVNPETLRRYLRSGSPAGLEFVVSFANAYGLSCEWLLCGRGPMLRCDLSKLSLQNASIKELLEALAEALAEALQPGSLTGMSGKVPAAQDAEPLIMVKGSHKQNGAAVHKR